MNYTDQLRSVSRCKSIIENQVKCTLKEAFTGRNLERQEVMPQSPYGAKTQMEIMDLKKHQQLISQFRGEPNSRNYQAKMSSVNDISRSDKDKHRPVVKPISKKKIVNS